MKEREMTVGVRIFNGDELIVMDWGLAHGLIEPSNEIGKATCDQLASEGLLYKRPDHFPERYVVTDYGEQSLGRFYRL
jgi:hypothetical protein